MAYFQYAVKYLCGAGDGINLARNPNYLTAINIHNPYDFPQDPICWKVVSPDPGPWQRTSLAPDRVMEINCQRLLNAGIQVGPIGFVVIRSPNELDVVAVYTVERDTGPVDILEIRNITPRIIQTDQPMCPG